MTRTELLKQIPELGWVLQMVEGPNRVQKRGALNQEEIEQAKQQIHVSKVE
jgi:hypothetical protein